jgi:hypothetical protein
MKRICLYIDADHLKQLTKIGKKKGLKVAQMIRLAMGEYVENEQRTKR